MKTFITNVKTLGSFVNSSSELVSVDNPLLEFEGTEANLK